MTIAGVGIFGGTFDPPHNAHLVAAVAARHQLGLDRVLMVVAGDPWQKQGEVVAGSAARLEMVRLACTDVEGVVPCDIEVARAGPTYTIDTIEALEATDFGGRELVLILGADAVERLDTWHRAGELAAKVSVAAMPRWSDGGAPHLPSPPSDRWRVVTLSIPRLDIASHRLRAACASGAPIDGLAPPAVVRYLRDHRLYTRSDDRGVDGPG